MATSAEKKKKKNPHWLRHQQGGSGVRSLSEITGSEKSTLECYSGSCAEIEQFTKING